MAAFNFGTDVDGRYFVEVQDSSYVDPSPDPVLGSRTLMVRPPAGFTLKVKDAVTLADLPDVTTQAFGYWSFSSDTAKKIVVSADGGATYKGPLMAIEAEVAAVDSGTTAATALSTANAAQTTANQALTLAQQGGGGGGGGTGTVNKVAGVAPDATGNVPLTATNLGARPTNVPISAAADITGLAPVAISNNYNDLNSLPAVRDVDQNADGSWPNRPATTRRCTFNSLPGNTTLPPTSGSTSGGVGMVAGFDIYIQWPA